MEEFKGTKGKWHVGEDSDVYDENGFDIVEMSHPMRIKENWEETGVRHWGEKKGVSYVDTTDEEVEANARLIAAAPELLEVVLHMKGEMEKPLEEVEDGAGKILYDKMQSVIAKALGKEDSHV